MKALLLILIFSTEIYSKSMKNNTYIIKFEEIDTIKYIKKSFEETALNISIKEAYWENFFDFTFLNINKKTTIQIDNITVHPHVFEFLYNELELSIHEDTNISKNLNRLIAKKKIHVKEIDTNKKSKFLEKMLIKYNFNSTIISMLIQEYHAHNRFESSKKCINIYEKNNLKNIDLKRVYTEIYDCYRDLNKTKQAFNLLDTVKPFIEKTEQYTLLEKQAFLFFIEKNRKEAKRYYKKAIMLFKKTDFLNNTNLSKEEKIMFLKINDEELLRLKKQMKNL